MGWNLYLVRFRGGEPDSIPLLEAAPVLEEHGTLTGKGEERELLPASAAEIGSRVTIDCTEGAVRWVTIERPRDTAVFRTFVFDLLQNLGMTAIDPSGGPVLIGGRADPSDLPEVYQTHFERVRSPDEILT